MSKSAWGTAPSGGNATLDRLQRQIADLEAVANDDSMPSQFRNSTGQVLRYDWSPTNAFLGALRAPPLFNPADENQRTFFEADNKHSIQAVGGAYQASISFAYSIKKKSATERPVLVFGDRADGTFWNGGTGTGFYVTITASTVKVYKRIAGANTLIGTLAVLTESALTDYIDLAAVVWNLADPMQFMVSANGVYLTFSVAGMAMLTGGFLGLYEFGAGEEVFYKQSAFAVSDLNLLTADILDGSITEPKFATGAVSTRALADLNVTTAKLNDLAVTNAKIAAQAVDTAKIAALAVTSAELAANAVTTAKLNDLAVTTAKLNDLGVTSAKLNDLAVTTAKLNDVAVTTAKIALLAVDTAQLAALAVTNAKIGALAVDTAKLADLAVTTAKIVDLNITTVKIADLNITTAKIAALAVTTSELAGSAVTTAKIADGNVTTVKIGDSQVTTLKIADSNVTTAKIGDSQVTTVKIGDSQVTTLKIGDFNITSEKLLRSGDNQLENPGFELSATAGWTLATGITIVNDGNARTGSFACKYATDGVGGPNLLNANIRMKVEAGDQVFVSAWLKGVGSAGTMQLAVRWRDAAEVQIQRDVVASAVGPQAAYVQVSGFATAPAGAVYAIWDMGENNSDTTAAPWYIDDCVMVRAITTGLLVAGAVTAAKIAAHTITANEIAALTITAAEIAAATITGGKIAAATITASNLVADTITANEIAANAITSSELAANAVIAGKIAALTIVAGDIAASTITGAKIAAGTITASNITALTITANEIAASTITGAKIAANTITAGNITALTITAAEIAASTITGGKIAANTITASNITALTITAAEIAAATITGAKIAANTITAGNIVALTITAAEIAASTITGAKIAALTITTGLLAADTITSDKIAAHSIGVEQLFVGSFDNLILDPGFEQGTTLAANDASGWQTNGYTNGGGTWSIQASTARSGTNAARFDPTGQATDTDLGANWKIGSKDGHIAVTEGDQLYFECWNRKVGAGTPCDVNLRINWTKVDGTFISADTSGATTPTAVYTKKSVFGTAPALTAYANFVIRAVRIAGATELVHFDDAYARRMTTGSIVVDGTITGAKIAANTITASNITALTITAAEIAAGTITGAKIAATTITAANIAALTITAAEIAASTITGGKIAANTITAGNITALTITAAEIAATTITAGKLNISTLSSIVADVGTLNAGKIQNAGATVGILLSGALPGGWTTYLNLVATTDDPLLQVGSAISITANGAATFAGVVAASSLTVSNATIATGALTAKSNTLLSAVQVSVVDSDYGAAVKRFTWTEQNLKMYGDDADANLGTAYAVLGDYNSVPAASLTLREDTADSTTSSINGAPLVWTYAAATTKAYDPADANMPSYDNNYYVEVSLEFDSALVNAQNFAGTAAVSQVRYKINSGAFTAWTEVSSDEIGVLGTVDHTPFVTTLMIQPGALAATDVINFEVRAGAVVNATKVLSGSVTASAFITRVYHYTSSATPLSRRGLFLGAQIVGGVPKPHLTLEPLTTAPTTAQVIKGEMWFEDAGGGIALRFYDGTNIKTLTDCTTGRLGIVQLANDLGGTATSPRVVSAQLDDGAVGTPAMRFTNDTNTGLYRAGADDLRVSAGGADIAKLTASGLFSKIGGSTTLGRGLSFVGQLSNLTRTANTMASMGTISLPAAVLATDGDSIRITLRGREAVSSSAVCGFQIKFGATTVANITITASALLSFDIDITITRTGATTQLCRGLSIIAQQNTSITNPTTRGEQSAPGETLSGAITIDVLGQSDNTRVLTLDSCVVVAQTA